MNKIKVIKIPFAYERPEPNKVTAFDLVDIESKIDHKILDKRIVKIIPSGFGGNHYHERVETWLAMGGELELVWIEDAIKKSIIMNPGGSKDICLITISSNVPHVVKNISSDDAYLVEYADQTQTNAVPFDVLGS